MTTYSELIDSTTRPTEADLVQREERIRATLKVVTDAQREVLRERAKRAVVWIIANRSDLTFGAPGEMHRINSPDTGSLADFEGYRQSSDAVLLHEADFGQVWWLNPGERNESTQRFAFIESAGSGVAYEIRFIKG